MQTEAELVTTHELGHNWGSEHDPATSSCTPASQDGGNFIMFAYSNQGFEANNFVSVFFFYLQKFSPCSIISMTEVLKGKAPVCFKEKSQSFCGNSRIEVGEECDGGIITRQGSDPCCSSNCRLRSNAICSDLNHDCCLNCTFAPSTHICHTSRTFYECYSQQAYCNGTSKFCPEQVPSPKGTPCSKFDAGKCNGVGHCLSICKQRNPASDSCLCKTPEYQCVQCCTDPLSISTCLPFHKLFTGTIQLNLTDGRNCNEGRCENVSAH